VNLKRYFAVIVNPIAGRGRTIRHFSKLKSITDQTGHKFDYYITSRPYHATQIADKIYREYDAVIAYGGDGTANEVMNGLAGTPTPFGIIPKGSGNDFARSLNITDGFQKAVEAIVNYDLRLIDLGTIGERVFLNGVGIGFAGFANYRSRQIKLLRGSTAYLWAILTSLTLWKAIQVNLEIDDIVIKDGKIYLIAIGNGSSSGGGFKLTPRASIHDSIFDICQVADIPVWKILLNFGRLKNGTLEVVKEVTMHKGKKIKVSSNFPLPIHFDGELFEPNVKEVTVSIVPQSAYVIGRWNA